MGELPSYLQNLEDSLENERDAREAEAKAHAEKEAALEERNKELEADFNTAKNIAWIFGSVISLKIAYDVIRYYSSKK